MSVLSSVRWWPAGLVFIAGFGLLAGTVARSVSADGSARFGEVPAVIESSYGPAAAADPAPALPADFRDATYEIAGRPVTLTGGVGETDAAPGSAQKVITRYFGNEAVGDLNGDGRPDVTFLLTQTGGGSGTFFYAVAALNTEQGYIGTNGVLLGDRVAPQSTWRDQDAVVVAYADRAAGQPMTARPSVGVTKTLRVVGGRLIGQ